MNQYNQKKIVHTINIATRFVRNNIKAQNARSKLNIANSIQTTTNGGINDAAIATQAIDSQSLVNLSDITATIAENIAIKKSITFGELRANISFVSIFNQTRNDIIAHINIDATIESKSTLKATLKNFCAHLAIAKATQLIGLSNGAINMAHITTATEFCNNHKAAIQLDKNISIQYNLSQAASDLTFKTTSSFCSFSSHKNSIPSKKVLTFSSFVSSGCIPSLSFFNFSSFLIFSFTSCFISLFSAFVNSSFDSGILFKFSSIISFLNNILYIISYFIISYKKRLELKTLIFFIYHNFSVINEIICRTTRTI